MDDEPRILSGLGRQLRGRFRVITAESGPNALELLASDPQIAVLVSDMRMPGMDGATLCSLARARFPDVVRIILSGQSDFQASLKAVNEGQIFRFLTKPATRDQLVSVLDEAVLLRSRRVEEKRILEETLHGAVDALGDALALGNPEVFGRATRLRQLVRDFSVHCGIREWWEIEVAALFSQIGWVTVPPTVIAKYDRGESLAPAEQEMVDKLLAVPDRVLAHIPRMDTVRAIIRYSRKRFDGTGEPKGPGGEHIPWGARVIYILCELERLESQGQSVDHAVQILSQREGRYDPNLLEQLTSFFGGLSAEEIYREVTLHEVRTGHRFVEPVETKNGMLLVARGQTATVDLLERLENFARGVGIREPLTVAIPIHDKHAHAEGDVDGAGNGAKGMEPPDSRATGTEG
ncbi:MAG: response regulator [Candidatus Eisenbacteria bacterium]